MSYNLYLCSLLGLVLRVPCGSHPTVMLGTSHFILGNFWSKFYLRPGPPNDTKEKKCNSGDKFATFLMYGYYLVARCNRVSCDICWRLISQKIQVQNFFQDVRWTCHPDHLRIFFVWLFGTELCWE